MRARLFAVLALSCSSCTTGELAEDTPETSVASETGDEETDPADSEATDGDPVDSGAPDSVATDTSVAMTDTATPMDTAPVDTGPPSGAAAVCARWKADRAS